MNLKDQVGKGGAYVEGVVLVKFAKDVTEEQAEQIAEKLGYKLGEKVLSRNWYRVEVPVGSELSAIAEFRLNDLVVTAELNCKVHPA